MGFWPSWPRSALCGIDSDKEGEDEQTDRPPAPHSVSGFSLRAPGNSTEQAKHDTLISEPASATVPPPHCTGGGWWEVCVCVWAPWLQVCTIGLSSSYLLSLKTCGVHNLQVTNSKQFHSDILMICLEDDITGFCTGFCLYSYILCFHSSFYIHLLTLINRW